MQNSNMTMIRRTELIERGWTRTNIRAFLGEPDLIESWGDGSTVLGYMYGRDRVEAVERLQEFRGVQRRRANRAVIRCKKAVQELEQALGLAK